MVDDFLRFQQCRIDCTGHALWQICKLSLFAYNSADSYIDLAIVGIANQPYGSFDLLKIFVQLYLFSLFPYFISLTFIHST